MKKPTLPPGPSTAASSRAADTIETLATIGRVARSSVVDAVADRLRGEILSERLAAGTRLPSERELSVALGVNRLTLRAALARLEAVGLVSTRHGAGTLISSWRERAGLDALAVLIGSLRPGDPAWGELLTSMLEVRRFVAAEAVALAAVRHTEEDLRSMKELAEQQAARLPDPVLFARGDLAFERAIVRAARNLGLELLLNTFARFPDEHPELVASLYDRRERTLEFYGFVTELVRAGDGEVARDTVRRALEAIDAEWLLRHGVVASGGASAVKGIGKSKGKAPKARGGKSR